MNDDKPLDVQITRIVSPLRRADAPVVTLAGWKRRHRWSIRFVAIFAIIGAISSTLSILQWLGLSTPGERAMEQSVDEARSNTKEIGSVVTELRLTLDRHFTSVGWSWSDEDRVIELARTGRDRDRLQQLFVAREERMRPEYVFVCLETAWAARDRGDRRTSRIYVDRLLAVDSQNYEGRLLGADLQQWRGEFDGAASALLGILCEQRIPLAVLARAQHDLADIVFGVDAPDAAEILYRSALESYELIECADGKAVVLCSLGLVQANRGSWVNGESAVREGLSIFTNAGNLEGTAYAAECLGTLLALRGRFGDAEGLYLDALRGYGKADRPSAVADVLDDLSAVYWSRGELIRSDEAAIRASNIWKVEGGALNECRAITEQAQITYRTQGESAARELLAPAFAARTQERNIGADLHLVRSIDILDGLLPDARLRRALHEMLLAWRRNTSSPLLLVRELVRTSKALLATYDFDEAEAAACDALQRALELGLPLETAESYEQLGDTLFRRGRVGEAESSYVEALELNRRLGRRRSEAQNLGDIGDTILAQNDIERAEAFYLKAREMLELCQDERGVAFQNCRLGQLYCDWHAYSRAEDTVLSAMQTYERLGCDPGMAQCYRVLGTTAERQGDWHVAARYYDTASSLLAQSGYEIQAANIGALASAVRSESTNLEPEN